MDVLDSGLVPELAGIYADTTDNALQIPVDGTRLSFYAARDGIDHPDLSGGSKVKKVVVSEMQLQIDGLSDQTAPPRLVLLYEADRDGLASAAVGKLRSEKSWTEDWRFGVYEREAESAPGSTTTSDLPTYEDQPEPELPDIDARPEDEEGEASSDIDSD